MTAIITSMAYMVFELIADTPNIWIWLFIFTAPILVFVIGPEKKLWLRLGRLILAIGLTYIFLFLCVWQINEDAWNDFQKCQKYSSHRDMSHEMYEECKTHLKNSNDTRAVFAAFFGLIPAICYVGFLELLWRIFHRSKIRQLAKTYRGKWISNSLIFIAIPMASYSAYKIIKLIYFLYFNAR